MKKSLMYCIAAIILVSCSQSEETYLCMENYSYDSKNKEIVDSIKIPLVDTNTMRTIPDKWSQMYHGPYEATTDRSYTITSPVGAGSITIKYKVDYDYGVKLIGAYDRVLMEVGDIYSFSMQRNTNKYLLMTNPNGVAGPINIVPSVDVPLKVVYCTISVRITGDSGFFDTSSEPTNEIVQFYDSFNINNVY